jgi:hypothetical protein
VLLRQLLAAIRLRASEAALCSRLAQAWLATGAVPVVHLVAELDDLDAALMPTVGPIPHQKPVAVRRRMRGC